MCTPNRASAAEEIGSFNAAAQAHRAAILAARRAGVTVRHLAEIADLRTVSGLLESVWGRTPEGVPVNSELLRSLVHSGGCVTAAFDDSGRLVGSAALTVAAPPGTTYSLIAAVAPGVSDRGVGYAVKQHQRVWALDRGYDTMVWTFDPLVSRNARFNLVKLGAEAGVYEQAFYGRMSDEINGADEADRLVAAWALGSRRAVAASEGTAAEPKGPAEQAEMLVLGPDEQPMLYQDETGQWCRVPRDVVALRRDDPSAASRWRIAIREVFVRALADGLTATHMTRDGWYLLTTKGAR